MATKTEVNTIEAGDISFYRPKVETEALKGRAEVLRF